MAEQPEDTGMLVRPPAALEPHSDQNLALSYVQFWRLAWLEFQRSGLYRQMKPLAKFLFWLFVTFFGFGLIVAVRFLLPFLPIYGWIILALSLIVVSHTPAIHYFVKFHRRTKSELETANRKLLASRAVPRELTLSEIEQRYGDRYEVKPLEPNLLAAFEVESMPAYNDSNGMIMVGVPIENSGLAGFYVYVAAISNRSRRSRVAPLGGVAARLTYHDFEKGFIRIERGNWLSEKHREMDFPPNGSPHRLVLAVVENDNRVCAVRRDLESDYSGPRAAREELKANLYKVEVELFAVAGEYRKGLKYILEIRRDPEFKVEVSRWDVWMTYNLSALQHAGYNLIFKAYDISKARHEKIMALKFDDPKNAEVNAEENQHRAELSELENKASRFFPGSDEGAKAWTF